MPMNLRFDYLYRDGGNNKNWGEVVFFNPTSIDAETASEMARHALADSAYFVASKVGIPDLHFAKYDEELDHAWHEFLAFQPTEEAPKDSEGRSVEEFINALKRNQEQA